MPVREFLEQAAALANAALPVRRDDEAEFNATMRRHTQLVDSLYVELARFPGSRGDPDQQAMTLQTVFELSQAMFVDVESDTAVFEQLNQALHSLQVIQTRMYKMLHLDDFEGRYTLSPEDEALRATIQDRLDHCLCVVYRVGRWLLDAHVIRRGPAFGDPGVSVDAVGEPNQRVPAMLGNAYEASILNRCRTLNTFQTLVSIADYDLGSRGARRVGTDVHVPIRGTVAYQHFASLDQYVNQYLCPRGNDHIRRLLDETAGMRTNVRNNLEQQNDGRFRELVLDRFCMAFANGTYDVETNTFMPSVMDEGGVTQQYVARQVEAYVRRCAASGVPLQDGGDVPEHLATEPTSQLLERLSAEEQVRVTLAMQQYMTPTGPGDRSACIYHPVLFEVQLAHQEDPWDIPTPHFDSIFEAQDLDKQDAPLFDAEGELLMDPDYPEYQRLPPPKERVMTWIYALMGRHLFPMGLREHWEIMTMIVGVAGSGKSTLLQFLRSVYPVDRVGTIGNVMERVFGLQNLLDKWMIIAPELRSNSSLDQATWQSMISGESVMVPRKNQTAVVGEVFQCHVIGAANEHLNFKDAGGCNSRRQAIIPFNHKPKDVDTGLKANLKEELPKILQKIVGCYLALTEDRRGADFWRVCPEFFRTQRNNNMAHSNTLVNFLLHDGTLSVYSRALAEQQRPDEEHYYMLWSDLQDHYRLYCKKNNKRQVDLTAKTNYDAIFAEYGIRVEEGVEQRVDRADGEVKPGVWVFGVQLMQHLLRGDPLGQAP